MTTRRKDYEEAAMDFGTNALAGAEIRPVVVAVEMRARQRDTCEWVRKIRRPMAVGKEPWIDTAMVAHLLVVAPSRVRSVIRVA